MSQTPASKTPRQLDHGQRTRATVLLILASILLCGLFGRMVYVGSTLRPELVALAKAQRKGSASIPARRGMIFDARGRTVALTRQTPDVFVDPALVKDVDEFASALAARLNIDPAIIAKTVRRKKKSRYVIVANAVDAVTADAVRAMHHPALGLTDRAERIYPLGESLAHVLGWVGREHRGMGGVELAFDKHLGGKDGHNATIRDARRRTIRTSESSLLPPVDGGHIVLTIDAEIQRVVEKALADGISKHGAQSGLTVVMQPRTGDILAMACLPTFQPGESVRPNELSLRRNRILTDPVEPGSTFKPMIACGALDGGFVSTTEEIFCHNGTHRFGRRVLHDEHRKGDLNLRGIITHSSNIGMGIIGERMGNLALYDTVRRFGFGQRTGIELPGESSGLVYPLRRWGKMSATSIPIGYEILVTPLQLITAHAAILNDGVRLKPRLVRMTLSPDGRVINRYEGPQPVQRAATSDAASFMATDALVSVVANGSSKRWQPDPYRMLGKSGTVKLIDSATGQYEHDAYLSVFLGAAPVHDPELIVLTMIRRPIKKTGYYGATVAAPVVGEILRKSLPYLDIPADSPQKLVGL